MKEKFCCISGEPTRNSPDRQHSPLNFVQEKDKFLKKTLSWCNFGARWMRKKYVSHITHNIYNFIIHQQPQKQWKNYSSSGSWGEKSEKPGKRSASKKQQQVRFLLSSRCWKFFSHENCYKTISEPGMNRKTICNVQSCCCCCCCCLKARRRSRYG